MGYSESRLIDYELKGCLLQSRETGETLLKFDARAVDERTQNANFAGNGLASGGHTFRIATATIYNYDPYNHCVIIDGVQYILNARVPATQKIAGEAFGKPRKEMILSLE